MGWRKRGRWPKSRSGAEGAACLSWALSSRCAAYHFRRMPAREHPCVVLQEAAVKAAVLLGERHAGIEVDVPVKGIVDQEGALVEVTGAVRADPFTNKRCRWPSSSCRGSAVLVKLAVQEGVLAEEVPGANKPPRTILVARARPGSLTDSVAAESSETRGDILIAADRMVPAVLPLSVLGLD